MNNIIFHTSQTCSITKEFIDQWLYNPDDGMSVLSLPNYIEYSIYKRFCIISHVTLQVTAYDGGMHYAIAIELTNEDDYIKLLMLLTEHNNAN